MRECLAGLTEEVQRCAGGVGLGHGREETSESDVIRSFTEGFPGEVQVGVCGGPDPGVRSEQFAGLTDRPIMLSEMNAISTEITSPMGIVIDEEG